MTNGSLMKVESIAAFFNTFDQHQEIIGLENRFVVVLPVAMFSQVLLYQRKHSTTNGDKI